MFVPPAITRVAALLLVAATVPGCSIFDDENDVLGIWASRGQDSVFLEITSQRITTFDYAGDALEQGPDCYRTSVATIVTTDGDDYTVSRADRPGLRVVLTLKVAGDDLSLTSDGISEAFVRSKRTVDSFTPECSAR